jgi:hypothetical protein
LKGLLRTKTDPKDLGAALQTQLGINLSLASLVVQPPAVKGASHGIGHQLGALGVGHGHM